MKFLSETGLTYFLNKLKNIFVTTDAANTATKDFSLTIPDYNASNQYGTTTISKNGIVNECTVDSCNVKITSGQISCESTNTERSTSTTIIDYQGIVVNDDYGINDAGIVKADSLYLSNSEVIGMDEHNDDVPAFKADEVYVKGSFYFYKIIDSKNNSNWTIDYSGLGTSTLVNGTIWNTSLSYNILSIADNDKTYSVVSDKCIYNSNNIGADNAVVAPKFIVGTINKDTGAITNTTKGKVLLSDGTTTDAITFDNNKRIEGQWMAPTVAQTITVDFDTDYIILTNFSDTDKIYGLSIWANDNIKVRIIDVYIYGTGAVSIQIINNETDINYTSIKKMMKGRYRISSSTETNKVYIEQLS